MKLSKAIRLVLIAYTARLDAEARILDAQARHEFVDVVERVKGLVVELLDRPRLKHWSCPGCSPPPSSCPASSTGPHAPSSAASGVSSASSPSSGPEAVPHVPDMVIDGVPDELDEALDLLGDTPFPGMKALVRRYKALETLKERMRGSGLAAHDDPEQLLEAVVRMAEGRPAIGFAPDHAER